MAASDLKKLQADPAAFRAALRIDADGKTVPLAKALDPWQAKDFARLDPGWRRVAGQSAEGPSRGWIERPRGHSKTSDIAVMVAWALFASRRKIKGVVAAIDRDQARLDRDAIDTLVRLNPWLGQVLKVGQYEVTNTRTGSRLEIISSDAASSYGLLVDFIVCDEVTIWPKRDLFDSLLSSAAKRKNCLLLCIGNAGFVDSWQWELREAVRQDAAWYFSRLDGPVASWITEANLAEQKRLLPRIAYERLWLNIWGSGSGDALDPDDVDRAVRLKGPTKRAKPGWCYFAGLDLGLSRDAAALAVVGVHVGWREETEVAAELSDRQRMLIEAGLADEPEPSYSCEEVEGTGRLRLARMEVWTPPSKGKVDLETIEEKIVQLHGVFGMPVAADPWQAAYLIERLKKQGIRIESMDFTGNNLKSMCSAVLEAFTESNIGLYNHPRLIADLKALRVVEKSYGVRLESPRGLNGHGDCATALAIALNLAKTMGSVFAPRGLRSIICE